MCFCEWLKIIVFFNVVIVCVVKLFVLMWKVVNGGEM